MDIDIPRELVPLISAAATGAAIVSEQVMDNIEAVVTKTIDTALSVPGALYRRGQTFLKNQREAKAYDRAVATIRAAQKPFRSKDSGLRPGVPIKRSRYKKRPYKKKGKRRPSSYRYRKKKGRKTKSKSPWAYYMKKKKRKRYSRYYY